MDDFVNRQDLLDGIEELKQSPWFKNGEDKQDIQHYGYLERKEAVEVVTDLCIKKEPSVTPKEKTGKWIPVEYPTGVEAFGIKEMTAVALRCSVCEKEVDISDGDFKLCPYCGARMVSE